MAEKGNIRRDWLISRRLEFRKALADLADLHVWPANKDIAELESELLNKLAIIECKLSQDVDRKGSV